MVPESQWLAASMQHHHEQPDGSILSLPMLKFPEELNDDIYHDERLFDDDAMESSEEQEIGFMMGKSKEAFMGALHESELAEMNSRMLIEKFQLEKGGCSQKERCPRATHEVIADFGQAGDLGDITNDKIAQIASKMHKEYEVLQAYDLTKEEKKALQESSDEDIAATMQELYMEEFRQQQTPFWLDDLGEEYEDERVPGFPHSRVSSKEQLQSEASEAVALSDNERKAIQERKDAEMAAKLQEMFIKEIGKEREPILLKEMIQADEHQASASPMVKHSIFLPGINVVKGIEWPQNDEYLFVPESIEEHGVDATMLQSDAESNHDFYSDDSVIYYSYEGSEFEDEPVVDDN